MRVALISPCTLGPDSNPGWYMITAGIRALVRAAVGPVEFLMCDMLQDNAAHWIAAATCDAAIVCGNPRFTLSDDAWWEGGIWHRLAQLQAAGVRVIDGWAGSAYGVGTGRSVDEMAEEIGGLARNAQLMPYARSIHGRITRDPLMQRVYEQAGAPSVLLPCSSWWASDDVWHDVATSRPRDAISLMGLPKRPEVAAAIRAIRADMARERPVDVLASTIGDYLWAMGEGMRDARLVHDPAGLLYAYSGYERFLAMRIHAAIPAARMGARVHVIAIDTRATACAPFGLPITELQDLGFAPPQFVHGCAPDAAPIIETLREFLC